MRPGILLLVAIVIVVAVVAMALASRRPPARGKVRGRALLTANELDLLHRLEAAAPEVRFHAQVAMGALLEPAFAKKHDRRAWMSVRGTLSQKIVDFVAQDRRTGAVLAIIELDDRTHDSARDERRDAMLREGGYKVVRWQSTAKPDATAIRQSLLVAAATSSLSAQVIKGARGIARQAAAGPQAPLPPAAGPQPGPAAAAGSRR
jgi:hypothetical protein